MPKRTATSAGAGRSEDEPGVEGNMKTFICSKRIGPKPGSGPQPAQPLFRLERNHTQAFLDQTTAPPYGGLALVLLTNQGPNGSFSRPPAPDC